MSWLPELEWEKDAQGYQLEEREPEEHGAILTHRPGGWYIKGNGGERQSTYLIGLPKQTDPVFIDLANLMAKPRRTSIRKPLVAFAESYGLPGISAKENELWLEHILDLSWKVRNCLDLIEQDRQSELKLKLGNSQMRYDEKTGYLVLKAGSLTGFIWMQVLLAFQKKLRIKRCPECHRYMIPKSDKRQWCSEACKKRAHRQQKIIP